VKDNSFVGDKIDLVGCRPRHFSILEETTVLYGVDDK